MRSRADLDLVEERAGRCIDRVDDAVLRLVAELEGSVGAEHGIGAAKRDWLRLTRTPAELAAMRAIKRALDPADLLNPGVLLPPADG